MLRWGRAAGRPGRSYLGKRLQLLPARENAEKSNLSFGEWLKTRDQGFLEKHLVPTDLFLWSVGALPEFVAGREDLIRRLRQVSQPAGAPISYGARTALAGE